MTVQIADFSGTNILVVNPDGSINIGNGSEFTNTSGTLINNGLNVLAYGKSGNSVLPLFVASGTTVGALMVTQTSTSRTQGTTPWITSPRAAGQDFSGATIIAAGSTNIWFPQAGSKAILLGYSISNDSPTDMKFYFSGTVAGGNDRITGHRLGASSNVNVDMSNFLCSGPANCPVCVAVGSTTNIDITVFCRSSP